MTRYNFQTNKPYAAKLNKVSTRPIENDPAISLTLIRLEFAIYWKVGEQRLESQGEIACRELVVGPLIPRDRDAGLLAYAQALRMATPPEDPGSWIHLQRRERWIEITFGPRETEGSRNPFRNIRPFSPDGWSIKEYRYDRTAGWVTIAAAADAVQVSKPTVRRRLDELEQNWGGELVTRTDGGHRRIYLPLFMRLWNE
ncbi:LysR family transcriptional regulator [Rubripirellula amarantea]|nr:LysR family transcriptional regulator [Rubripirellula amarantea]